MLSLLSALSARGRPPTGRPRPGSLYCSARRPRQVRIDLDGAARDEAVDQHLAPLADAQGAVGGPMSMGVIYEPTTFTPRQANGFHAADVGRLIRMLKTLYVANPYGFSAQQKAGPLVALVDALTAAGAEVTKRWEPFARSQWASTSRPRSRHGKRMVFTRRMSVD